MEEDVSIHSRGNEVAIREPQTMAVGSRRVLLTLSIQQNAEGHVLAMAPVRWCLTPYGRDRIKANEYKKPYVMLLVRNTFRAPGSEYEEHQITDMILTPLSKEMTFVSFSRPGINEIHAFIVDVPDGEDYRALKRQNWKGSNRLLKEDGNPDYDLRGCTENRCSECGAAFSRIRNL